jgi:F0F1-type ATP synthase assembly protein I
MLAKLDSGELEADLAVAGMKEKRSRENAEGLELFENPDQAFEAVDELQNDQEKLEQRLSELDSQLKQTIGESNVRLSDEQKEALEDLADQIDSPYSGHAVNILLNYMSVETTGATLGGILATSTATGPMGGVVLAMGVVSTVATILPHVVSMLEEGLGTSPDDNTSGTETEEVDY